MDTLFDVSLPRRIALRCMVVLSSTGFRGCGKNSSFLFRRLRNRRFLAIREIYLLAPGSRLLPFSLFGSPLGTSLRPQAGLGINFTKRTKFEAAAPKQNPQSTRRRPRNFVCQNPATDFSQPKFFSINFRFA